MEILSSVCGLFTNFKQTAFTGKALMKSTNFPSEVLQPNKLLAEDVQDIAPVPFPTNWVTLLHFHGLYL